MVLAEASQVLICAMASFPQQLSKKFSAGYPRPFTRGHQLIAFLREEAIHAGPLQPISFVRPVCVVVV